MDLARSCRDGRGVVTASVAASTPLHMPSQRGQRWIEALAGIGFSMPAFLLLLMTNLAPLVALGVLSFTNYELGAVEFNSVGLANFQKALHDPVIRHSLANTFLYV